MTDLDPARVRRILIRVNNWIGDVVMISPAVRAIREHFSEARIAILARSWVLETLRGSPFYDELIEYDRGGRHRGAVGRCRLVAELRRGRYDLAILFQKAFEAAALAFLAGVPSRIGYAADFRTPLLTTPLTPPPPGTHHVEVFLGLARALGCPVRDPEPTFHLDEASRQRAGSILQEAGRVEELPLLAIHPGASKEPRAWHPERFGDLAGRLSRGTDAQVVLLGGPSDHEELARIASYLPPRRAVIPARPVSIKEMGAILERCRIFIGNDSGPMHVAAALGVPTVGIFGPGSPSRTAPIARPGRLQIVSRFYPCSPCRQRFFRECPPAPSGKPFCLEEISVEEVERAALRLLR